MSLQIPPKMDITLPRLSDRELNALYRFCERTLPDDKFSRRLRIMLGSESRRRSSADPIEPTMEALQLSGGLELSQALSAVRRLETMPASPSVRHFVYVLARHVFAMTEAALELFDEQISQALMLRRSNTQAELLRPSEVSAMLGISEATLAAMVKAGSFPQPTRVGRRRFWLESNVTRFMEQKRREAEDK